MTGGPPHKGWGVIVGVVVTVFVALLAARGGGVASEELPEAGFADVRGESFGLAAGGSKSAGGCTVVGVEVCISNPGPRGAVHLCLRVG